MKCDYCGKEESLPFICNYCGGTFCSEHRLPEAHSCKGDLSRKTVAAPSGSTFSWGGSAYGSTSPLRRAVFSRVEVRDIISAWVALGLAFFLAEHWYAAGTDIPFLFATSLVAVGSGFVLHELMHKFVAEHYGYWAEFRMWTLGLVLALATSVAGFIFAAPGATYIQGADVSPKRNAIISLAGPLTNVVVALVFLPFLLVGNLLAFVGAFGFQVNLFLATFNMLPIPPLDGSKVFRWSILRWTVVFVPLALVTAVIFIYPALIGF